MKPARRGDAAGTADVVASFVRHNLSPCSTGFWSSTTASEDGHSEILEALVAEATPLESRARASERGLSAIRDHDPHRAPRVCAPRRRLCLSRSTATSSQNRTPRFARRRARDAAPRSARGDAMADLRSGIRHRRPAAGQRAGAGAVALAEERHGLHKVIVASAFGRTRPTPSRRRQSVVLPSAGHLSRNSRSSTPGSRPK